MNDSLLNALVSIGTTFLGAFLAIGLTYLYEKHKAKSVERDERRKVLHTIHHELAGNLKRIESFFSKEAAALRALEAQLNETKHQGSGTFAPHLM